MNLDAMFEKYPNILIGARMNGGQKIFDFWKSKRWSSFIMEEAEYGEEDEEAVDGETVNTDDKLGVTEEKPLEYIWKHQKSDPVNDRDYYILHSDKLNFSELFNVLSTYLEYNMDMEKKHALFSVKVKELEKIFNKLNYTEASKVEIKVKK